MPIRHLLLAAALLLVLASPAAAATTANPLDLRPAPPGANPLLGARFFVDEQWGLANRVSDQLRNREPGVAAQLRVIADQPETKRYGSWTANPRGEIAAYLQRARAADPGAVPLLGTYRLHHLSCGGVSDSPAEDGNVKRWYDELAGGIGSRRAVVFVEIDALITTGCLSHHGLATRVDELRHALAVLGALPHAVVYVDAGAADAQPPSRMAKLLRRIGAGRIEGFFTNATHEDWTSREIRYGEAISRRAGGEHFVVNTAVNGRGPLVPRDRVRFGNAVLCNPPGRGLGPKPTATVPTTYGPSLDGFFWIGNPGRSGGACGRGDPPTGTFFLSYALMLIRNADFRIR
jgi:endoglucanase